MIGYIKGEVTGIYDDSIILEVGGIGYNINMPASSIDLLEGIGQTVRIYTYLHVREDAMQLYGFFTRDDLELYKMLISVGGIGPKGALAVLSVMTADELRFAILAGDSKQISKAPGVGAKTAQRIIIDLKDKIDMGQAFEREVSTVDDESYKGMSNSIKDEAVEALVALGYSQTDSYRAVRSVVNTDSVEAVLKQALTNMNNIR